MSEEIRVWGIHTYDDNLFLKENVIAIGWREMGDLSLIAQDREAFKEKYTEVYKDAKKGSIPTCAGMLYRFVNEAKIGDYVVFPSRSNREVNIGQITGEYRYDAEEHDYVQKRDVKWLKHFKRTVFTQGALYEIGAAQSFFLVKNYADEFLSALDKNFKNSDDSDNVDDTVAATAEEIIESTKDYILKELSRKLKGYDLEEFIADLLNGMGYRTKVSPHGGDNGIDITAYKGDYGLFVTLSNYTKNARKYLEAMPIIRAINGTELVDLILKYYDKLSEKYRKMIPLKMVYIPVQNETEE